MKPSRANSLELAYVSRRRFAAASRSSRLNGFSRTVRSVKSQLVWLLPKRSEPACCKILRFLLQCQQSLHIRSILIMAPRELALFSSLFHFPAGIAVTSIHPSANDLVIGVACQTSSMPCPQCQQPSARIHSRYQRLVECIL